MADLSQQEIQQRIVAARVLRGISQRDLDRMAAADGYGKTEMSRVERGELEFRAGKHVDPLTRYLGVPRWWFTAETITLPSEPEITSTDERVDELAREFADFRVWANDAVERMLDYRTEAYGRLLERIEQLAARQTTIAADLEAVSARERRRAAVEELADFAARDAVEDEPEPERTRERPRNRGEG